MKNIEKIYTENVETVRKYLFCLTHNDDIAEELTQETFYRAIRKINSFKNNSKISTWLCQIAKNLWFDELKKNRKIKNISEEEMLLIKSKDKVEDAVILRDNKLQLFKNMQKLDRDMKEVVQLRIIGELTFKEIGDVLGKTENWARVVFYRAKIKLKEVDCDEGE